MGVAARDDDAESTAGHCQHGSDMGGDQCQSSHSHTKGGSGGSAQQPVFGHRLGELCRHRGLNTPGSEEVHGATATDEINEEAEEADVEHELEGHDSGSGEEGDDDESEGPISYFYFRVKLLCYMSDRQRHP